MLENYVENIFIWNKIYKLLKTHIPDFELYIFWFSYFIKYIFKNKIFFFVENNTEKPPEKKENIKSIKTESILKDLEYVYIFVHVDISIYTYVPYAYTCVYICMYSHMYINICIYAWIYSYTFTCYMYI